MTASRAKPEKRPLDVSGLQECLLNVDKHVVLVSARILERIIRENYDLPNMYWNLPHYKSFVCQRETLFRHAEQADLELKPDQILPETVILLLRPAPDELSSLERQRLLLKYWRRLFHSRVHMALESNPNLTDEAIRERIEKIGRTEFEEIRNVLVEDRYLPAQVKSDDRKTYIEFAAVYLELRYFSAALLENVFPGIADNNKSGIGDFGKIERLLSADINAAQLFQETRLPDAPNPIMKEELRTEESQEAYWKLVRQAQSAESKGNIVRAAILRMRASRIAPAAQTIPTRLDAERNLSDLTTNLAAALGISETEKSDWTRHLTLLLDKADQGQNPVEAQVLFNLQDVWLSEKRNVFTLDLVEWISSLGKRPIQRPLPSQKIVRITKHLRSALSKLIEVRLSDVDRSHFERLMLSALNSSEVVLRKKFGPVLRTAMEDVGLKPTGPVEQVAFEKMVDELLDRIIRYGFLTFPELRDTISRNQLKLPDVQEPEFFLRGDPLIRLDRRLASLLDGVYRPGEIYVRYLERASSLGFGTGWGRWITRYLVGPFFFAWVLLFILGMVIDEVWSFFPTEQAHQVVGALMGAAYMPKGGALLEAVEYRLERGEDMPPHAVPWGWHLGLVLAAGFFVMALLYHKGFRKLVIGTLTEAWVVLHYLFWRLPLSIVPLTTLQRLVNSWVFQSLYWLVLKPLVVTGLLALFLHMPWPWWLAAFVLSAMVINSRPGRHASEGLRDLLVELASKIRTGLLLNLLHFIAYVFKQVSEGIEYVLFTVDEYLRFRTGDSQESLFIRTILSVFWSPIAFLIRFYTVVLIEPMINPLKLPISTVAAKILYPVLIGLSVQEKAVGTLTEFLPYWLAWLLVVPTIFLLPDAFGFLAWEMKENWRMYRSNRGESLRPVVVGSHGETVRGLLQPGFHSGTVPTLFARLREAERQGVNSRDWHKARQYRHEVEEVEQALARFVMREMVALLATSKTWKGEQQEEQIEGCLAHLATNRIRFTITHKVHTTPIEIEIEHNNHWIVAGIKNRGWLDQLTVAQRRVFATCLAGLYKLADVDLIREQMLANAAHPVAAARLHYEGIQVWPEPHSQGILYALRKARTREDEDRQLRLVFARTPISWKKWRECWERDGKGLGHTGVPGATELALPETAQPAESQAAPIGSSEVKAMPVVEGGPA